MVKFTKKEHEKLDKINEEYEKLKDILGYGNPMKHAKFYIQYIDLRKWVIGKTTGKVYFKNRIRAEIDPVSDDRFEEVLKKFFKRPDKHHPRTKKALAARRIYNIIGKRKSLLYNAHNKLSKTVELVEQYKGEYKFVFSQRIEFLDKLAELLPEDAIGLYHSKLNGKTRNEAYQKFIDGRTKVRTLLSVKSLIEGIDIPKLSVSIITSYTSSEVDRAQTWGRTMRKYKNKRAIIIYLYVPGTQEEVWLNNILK